MAQNMSNHQESCWKERKEEIVGLYIAPCNSSIVSQKWSVFPLTVDVNRNSQDLVGEAYLPHPRFCFSRNVLDKSTIVRQYERKSPKRKPVLSNSA